MINIYFYISHLFFVQAADSVAAKLNSAPISLMTQLINTISHHLPKTEPELATFRRTLESPCRLLEAKLRNFGFYLSDNADAGKWRHNVQFFVNIDIACRNQGIPEKNCT